MSEPTETDARAHDEREIRAIVDRMFDAWGRGDVVATTPTSDATQPGTGSTAPSVGAQLLATEHWSLLVTRSTTSVGFGSRQVASGLGPMAGHTSVSLALTTPP
jgi:hypothetical protein